MPDNDRLIYSTAPQWRGPEMVLLNTAVSVFVAFFAVPGIVAIVGGLVSGTAEAVFFGIFWSGVYAYIIWTNLHLASRLEFSGGYLSWRCNLPWFPRMRPGRISAVYWRTSRRSRSSRYATIELDDGRKVLVLPRPGLMEFIDGVREAEPTIVVDLQAAAGSRWARAESASYIQQRMRKFSSRRSFRIPVSIVVSLVLLGVVLELSLTLIGAQQNFQTLRTDLSKVRLPSSYHLVATRQAGNCAHGQCSLTQTWAWAPSVRDSSAAACADAQQALASAFSGADSNSPIPANAACDYYSILGDLLHPGQGKRTVEAVVLKCQAPRTRSCKIELTASYG